jgi:hypothetical protein
MNVVNGDEGRREPCGNNRTRRAGLFVKASRGGGGKRFWLKGSADDHMYRHVVDTVRQAASATCFRFRKPEDCIRLERSRETKTTL